MEDEMSSDYELTPTGLVVRDGWTPELWEAAGHEIARYQKGLMWLIGDWLNAGDREGYVERGKLAEACERFGISYDHAAQAVRVASAFESCDRSQHLTWTHHHVIANHPQAVDLIQWAEARKATVRQLKDEKQRRSIAAEPTVTQASGKKGEAAWEFKVGDCRSLPYPDDHFDLVFCSPSYEA